MFFLLTVSMMMSVNELMDMCYYRLCFMLSVFDDFDDFSIQENIRYV